MASRWFCGVTIVLAALAVATPTHAEGLGDFCASVGRDVKRRNCWPQPFVYADRQAAREPFALMVANGWERQNLLSDVHFEAGGVELSEAGRLKVLWILSNAPQQHRAIYVHRTESPEITGVRLRTTQEFVAKTAPHGRAVAVAESARSDEGTPADRVDRISRDAFAASPKPVLPAAGGAAGGGGGGGGGGAK